MDLSKFIDEKSYRLFAGNDWPKFEDFIKGATSKDPDINVEIDNFISTMKEKYCNITISGDTIAKENQNRQKQNFFNKNVNSVQCFVPWETLGVNSNGDLFICESPSWIPLFVGNILNIDDIFTALNSDTAISIRNEILNKRYTYCNNKICSFFANLDQKFYQINESDSKIMPVTDKELLTVSRIPKNLIFDFDYTCNFKCPSCRTEVINWNNDHIRRPINNQIVEKIKHLIIDQIDDKKISIRWAGGEPFISEPYLELFDYIISSGKQNIQNIIQTNGSYLKSKTVKNLLPYISELRISFDAGTKETYAKTRVNGNWDKLLENVKYIQEQIKELNTGTRVTADFVVQLDNYQDLPKFKSICAEYGISYTLQKMWNWGTWPIDEFEEKNIYNINHLQYQNLLKYL